MAGSWTGRWIPCGTSDQLQHAAVWCVASTAGTATYVAVLSAPKHEKTTYYSSYTCST